MIDKICCMVYKAINLMMWIICDLLCMVGIGLIAITPYLGCRYWDGVSVKNSIIATVAFWFFIGFARIVGLAYARGKQKSNKE